MFGQVPSTPYDLRFTLLGIPVRVHPVFWLTSAFLAWTDGRLDITFVKILCIFVAILIHELGHAVVTRYFGWQPEIVLYFFGGYATSMRHSTWKNIAVSAAGPIAGFLLFALLFFGVGPNLGRLLQEIESVRARELLVSALNFSLFINLLWNAMNLVPVLPLDGGQIARDLLERYRRRDGLEWSLKLSIAAAGAIVVWALVARSQNDSVLGLEPTFLAIMFGLLAMQNFQSLQENNRGWR